MRGYVILVYLWNCPFHHNFPALRESIWPLREAMWTFIGTTVFICLLWDDEPGVCNSVKVICLEGSFESADFCYWSCSLLDLGIACFDSADFSDFDNDHDWQWKQTGPIQRHWDFLLRCDKFDIRLTPLFLWRTSTVLVIFHTSASSNYKLPSTMCVL